MVVFSYCRGCGKTHDIVKYAKESGYGIIVSTAAEAQKIKSDYNFNNVFTIAELKAGKHFGTGINNFVVDNVELVLVNLFGIGIRALSVTANEVYVRGG